MGGSPLLKGAAILVFLGIGIAAGLKLFASPGANATGDSAPTGNPAESQPAEEPTLPPAARRKELAEPPPAPVRVKVPTPAPSAGPKKRVFQLKDGSTVEAIVLAEDPLAFRLDSDSGIHQLDKERIESLDGHPYILDLGAVFRHRLDQATSALELEQLGKWCVEKGLMAQRDQVAQRLLALQPENRIANGWMGNHRYRGSSRGRAELESLGALGPAGQLLGTLRDYRDIQRLYHATLGRPPLAAEYSKALELSNENLVEELSGDPSFYASWLGDSLRDLIGTPQLGPLGKVLAEVCEALAFEGDDFVSAWRTILESEAFERTMRDGPTATRNILHTLLGFEPSDDPELFRQAARMWKGERVAVLGDRGEAPDDFIAIVLRQPQFYRRTLDVLWSRLRGGEPDESEIAMQSFTLASDRSQLASIVKTWLSSSLSKDAPARQKSDEQLASGLWVMTQGKAPSPKERAAATAFLREAGSIELAYPLLAQALARRSPIEAPPENSGAQWLQTVSWRILGHRLSQEAMLPCLELLKLPQGHRRVLAEFLSSPNFRSL